MKSSFRFLIYFFILVTDNLKFNLFHRMKINFLAIEDLILLPQHESILVVSVRWPVDTWFWLHHLGLCGMAWQWSRERVHGERLVSVWSEYLSRPLTHSHTRVFSMGFTWSELGVFYYYMMIYKCLRQKKIEYTTLLPSLDCHGAVCVFPVFPTF